MFTFGYRCASRTLELQFWQSGNSNGLDFDSCVYYTSFRLRLQTVTPSRRPSQYVIGSYDFVRCDKTKETKKGPRCLCPGQPFSRVFSSGPVAYFPTLFRRCFACLIKSVQRVWRTKGLNNSVRSLSRYFYELRDRLSSTSLRDFLSIISRYTIFVRFLLFFTHRSFDCDRFSEKPDFYISI